MSASRLHSTVVGLSFKNPIVLAAGTAGYGEELAGAMDLDAVGGFVTKAVSLEPSVLPPILMSSGAIMCGSPR